MAKYLITGGCGFIGSHVAEELTNRGLKARLSDDLSTGSIENAPTNSDLIIGSITDSEKLLVGLDELKEMQVACD